MNVTPNHLKIHGDTNVSHWFGGIKSLTPSHPGGHPCARMELENHMQLELSTAFIADAYRRFGAFLAVPANMPEPIDCSAIAADLEAEA